MKTNIALFIATLAIVMFAIAANANTTGTGKDTTKVAKVYTINDLNGDSIKFKRDDSIRVWVKQPVKDSVETGRTWTNPKTGKPGKLPSNLSGGLIGCMHAVGATGIMQTFEIATQIWGRWAEIHSDEKIWKAFDRKKPADWTDLQVKGAKRALAISHAGVGSHVTATILMDPDHLLKKDA